MPVLLARRQNCYFDGAQEYCENNAWNDWVRWVVLVCVVVGFFLLFVFCSCLTARRRRRAGRQPIYGTGWASRHGHGEAQYIGPQSTPHHPAPAPNADPNWHAQSYANNPNAPGAAPYFNAQQGTWSQPPPSYSPPAQGYYAGGPQQYGYEMQSQPQQPPSAYQPQRATEGVYAPPEGPPPPKEDHVVR
ncbi:hypothetical protein K490DRAFT_64614 [Saccharata proteae CBS 121410]|uniref:Chitin synthesis regulation, resistance to congo red-domain-containing protein n=1 Tax=Saccharata proteae CBS 121410 TaxID=1314787 RepID=A0A9P4HZU3_9PEZI|nr:hypothetical protein K490DRAFT_64614 [Saccharata proteae CBS 121410]